MKKKVSSIVMGMLLMIPVASFAEESVYTLKEVVVTATRSPLQEFKVPEDISIITSEEIKNHHYQDLTDALRSVPSVSIAQYAPAGYEQSESVTINGTSDVLVLVDGVRVNLNGGLSGNLALSSLKNLMNVEKIEILKGAASTLYGSDAKGGVINIITRYPQKQEDTCIGGLVGQFDIQKYYINHLGKKGKIGWQVSYQKDKSGDFRDGNGVLIPSECNQHNYSVQLTYDTTPYINLRLSYDKVKGVYRYAGTNKQLDIIKNGKSDEDNFRIGIDYKQNQVLNHRVSLYRHTRNSIYDNWKMDLETLGMEDQISWNKYHQHQLVGGVSYYQDKVKSYDDREKDKYGKIKGQTFDNKKLCIAAIYVQDMWDFKDKWFLIGGLRYTHHSKAGSALTTALTIDYRPRTNTHLYIGAREYFKAPSLYHYYGRYGSEGLKAESGREYTFGLKHSFDDTFSLSFHTFHRNAKDVIRFIETNDGTFSPSGLNQGYYMNINQETGDGWAIRVEKKWGSHWRTFAGYQYIQSILTHQKAYENDPAEGEVADTNIPEGQYQVGVTYENQSLSSTLTARGLINRKGRYLSAKGDLPEQPAFPVESYLIVDWDINWQATSNLLIFGRVQNLFNKYYAEMSNVAWGNDGNGSPGEWWSAPGRRFTAGIEYHF